MRNLVLTSISTLVVCNTINFALAQVPTTPQAGAAEQEKAILPTQTLRPREGFGAIYGTDNLAAPKKKDRKVERKGSEPQAGIDAGLLKSLQDLRTQAPASLDSYTRYLKNEPLQAKLAEIISNNPSIDASLGIVALWNDVALDMTSIDHTTAGKKVGGKTVFEETYAEQFGPPRSSRAMAIVHLAAFEAANAIDERYTSYTFSTNSTIRKQILSHLPPNTQVGLANASITAAVNKAAYDALISLYPHKAKLLEAAHLKISILVSASEGTNNGDAHSRLQLGEQIGQLAAKFVSAERATDNSNYVDPTNQCGGSEPLPKPLCFDAAFPASVPPPISKPLAWTVDPIKPNRIKLGSNWSRVQPFAIKPHEFVESDGIHLPSGVFKTPVATDHSFEEGLNNGSYGPLGPDPHGGPPIPYKYGVRRFGASETADRTNDQTVHAEFWGYDATALLCAPPRLYNMIATSLLYDYIKRPVHTRFDANHATVDGAHYLAMVNIALADAAIAAWEAKYRFNIARPVTYIEIVDGKPPEGPSGWLPYGQVASNGTRANTTPPFPAWPSGHAVFGGAFFQVVSRLLDWDKITGGGFTFTSDEYNGRTFDKAGVLRPNLPQKFVSIKTAEWENAESRIFLGVHWQRDADDGTALGNAIGDKVYERALSRIMQTE